MLMAFSALLFCNSLVPCFICSFSIPRASSLPSCQSPPSGRPPPGQTLRGHCQDPEASLGTSSVLFLEVTVTVELRHGDSGSPKCQRVVHLGNDSLAPRPSFPQQQTFQIPGAGSVRG